MSNLQPGLLASLEKFAAQAHHRPPQQVIAAAIRSHLRLVETPPEPRPGPTPRRWWIRHQDLEA